MSIGGGGRRVVLKGGGRRVVLEGGGERVVSGCGFEPSQSIRIFVLGFTKI